MLFRRRAFLGLGGFPALLRYYVEEDHFCARAISEGWSIYMFPSLIIRHARSSRARSTARTAYYKGRNRVLLVLWHYPLHAIPFRLATSLPGTMALVSPRNYWAAVGGFLAGLCAGRRRPGERKPLSASQYAEYRALPSCYYPRAAADLLAQERAARRGRICALALLALLRGSSVSRRATTAIWRRWRRAGSRPWSS